MRKSERVAVSKLVKNGFVHLMVFVLVPDFHSESKPLEVT